MGNTAATNPNEVGARIPQRDYPLSEYGAHFLRRLYLQCVRPGKFRRFAEQRYRVRSDDYSCRPFDELRCIFVHIPKCAGISVSKSLFGNHSGAHHSLKRFQIMFGPKEFSEYFKFTFARNPWDRLASAFFFLKGGGLTDGDRTWAEKNLSTFKDFEAFVRYGIRLKKIRSFPHFRPQCEYICLTKNQPAVDFIGYFENLGADFSQIAQRLKLNSTLQELNRTPSKKKDYRDYYTEETRQLVAQAYADDIRVLGYSFDNSTLPSMLARRGH